MSSSTISVWQVAAIFLNGRWMFWNLAKAKITVHGSQAKPYYQTVRPAFIVEANNPAE